jgi:hypothetical protein
MEKINFLSNEDKETIARFIEHQLSRDDFKMLPYKLCDDFIECTEEDVSKYHMGMQWILEMMLHQIPFYPSKERYLKQQEMDARALNEI